LTGVNSYTRELGLNPVAVLIEALATQDTVAWLDLCCGSGRALIQGAEDLVRDGFADRAAIVGVDLVNAFDVVRDPAAPLNLICASAITWSPDRDFDLITCLHGLHYVGDKLGLLTRAASWLTETGYFIADLDLASVKLPDGQSAGPRLTRQLRAAGFTYDARRHRISCTGNRTIELPYRYLGADDHAGPNYTGQPAVDSYYAATLPG
jgi:SAM-dependent methyltransferase